MLTSFLGKPRVGNERKLIRFVAEKDRVKGDTENDRWEEPKHLRNEHRENTEADIVEVRPAVGTHELPNWILDTLL